MELIQLVVLLIVIGVLLWLVNNYIPMDATIKKIVNAVVVIAIVVWLLVWLLNIVGLAHVRVSLNPRAFPYQAQGGRGPGGPREGRAAGPTRAIRPPTRYS